LVAVVGVTGTPGTGKKSVAPLLAERLGRGCLGLNDFARSHGLVKGQEGEVDPLALKRALARELRGDMVVFGHLLPEVLGKSSVEKVVVLRCEPAVLKGRLRPRRYPAQQVVDNLEAELIGLTSADTFKTYGSRKTFEVDTTYTTPTEAASFVADVLRGKAAPGPRIDWTMNYDSSRKLKSLFSEVV